MRSFILALLLCLLGSSAFGQATSPTPPRPDVPADKWIALSPTLGFVITSDPPRSVTRFSTDPATGKQTVERSAPESAVVRGYFMILRNGQWLRLETEPPAARVFDMQQR